MGFLRNPNKIFWVNLFLAATFFTIPAYFLGTMLDRTHYFSFGGALTWPLTLAALVLSTGFWWWTILRQQRYKLARGCVVGGIVGLAIHPFTWFFDVLWLNICFYWLPNCACEEAPMALWQGFPSSITLSYFSLYPWGWVTIPTAMLIGAVCVLVQACISRHST